MNNSNDNNQLNNKIETLDDVINEDNNNNSLNYTSSNFNNNPLNHEDYKYINNNNKITPKSTTLLILAILNTIFILPFTFKFSIIYFLFGGLSGSFPNKTILIFASIYMIFSIIFLFYTIIKNISKFNILRFVLLVIIGLVIGLGSVYYNRINKKDTSNKIEYDIVLKETAETNIIYKRILYSKNSLYITFSLYNKTTDKYYNLAINKVKANDKLIDFKHALNTTNGEGYWIRPYSIGEVNQIIIENSDLAKYNLKIDDIKKLSFNFTLYSKAEETSENIETTNLDYFIDIIV